MITVYDIDLRNNETQQEPHYIIIKKEISEKEYADDKHYQTLPKTYKDAKDLVINKLKKRMTYHLECLNGLQHNLTNADTIYVEEPPLSNIIEQNRKKIVNTIKTLKEHNEYHHVKLGPLTISTDGSKSPYLFELDKYTPYSHTFDAQSLSLMMSIFKEAEFEKVQDWNGKGFDTWSVVLNPIS